MTLHPLTSKGGAFVLKLGLVFIKKGSPSGESFLIFGADENPPGEYLTPQNSKPKAGLLENPSVFLKNRCFKPESAEPVERFFFKKKRKLLT
jgi:hypothetical protein